LYHKTCRSNPMIQTIVAIKLKK